MYSLEHYWSNQKILKQTNFFGIFSSYFPRKLYKSRLIFVGGDKKIENYLMTHTTHTDIYIIMLQMHADSSVKFSCSLKIFDSQLCSAAQYSVLVLIW